VNLQAEAVAADLQPTAVLEHYGLKFKKCGSHEVESSACAQRNDHSRRALTMNLQTGRWQCFPCATSGDLFTFIALAERLHPRRDFPAVVQAAAKISGTTDSNAEAIERRRIEREEADRIEQLERQRLAAEAIPKATRFWESLSSRSERGEEYLTQRGLAALCGSQLVRFDAGSPSVKLHDQHGSIRNVVRRRLPELGEPKTPGLQACPTAGSLIHSLAQIPPSGVVVVTEGVVDSMTAALAWPGAAVLGAHGAGNMAKLAHGAAAKAALVRARLLLVPHNDKAGYTAARDAAAAAFSVGLSVQAGTIEFVRHGAKDLNEAWCGGWRP